ncbi:MAG: hypothetical protein II375_03385 [Bacteroidales bacterium]|nr:hypothetical protein [Bacteroidales bacterium]
MKRKRHIFALALLLALMPAIVVKATHFHDVDSEVPCHADSTGNSARCDASCPICDFVLPPFIEALPQEISFIPPCSAPLSAAYIVHLWRAPEPTPSLRAPPSPAA